MQDEDLNDPHTYWKEIIIITFIAGILLGIAIS
jgi:hypothetical protein